MGTIVDDERGRNAHDQETAEIPRQIEWEIKDIVHPFLLPRRALWRAGMGLAVLAALAFAAWMLFGRASAGEVLLQEMVAAAGGMERWNAITDGSFTRVHTRFDENGEAVHTEEVTYGFKKGEAGHRLFVTSVSDEGRIVIGRDEDGYWATKDGEPVAPITVARSLGMMCDSEYCTPLCGAEMTFYRFSLPFKLTDPGVVPTHLGDATLNGVPVSLLEVTFAEGVGSDRWVFYVDREEKLIRKVEHYPSLEGDAPPEEIFWSDHRPADGLTLSHRQAYYRSNGTRLEEYRVTEADFSTPLADELFVRPELRSTRTPTAPTSLDG